MTRGTEDGQCADGSERLSVEDIVDHEENCAACGVHDRVGDSRYCVGCRDALVRADGGTVEDGTEQAALSRDPDRRQLAEVDRDGRTPICPDCGADVAASKSGGKPLPGIVPECFGWECERCNLTLPSMCHGPEARGFIDTMAGIKVQFRDGSTRYVPVPARYVGPDENGGESA